MRQSRRSPWAAQGRPDGRIAISPVGAAAYNGREEARAVMDTSIREAVRTWAGGVYATEDAR